RAPSRAKSSAASRPCPIPAPVMNATFPLSLIDTPDVWRRARLRRARRGVRGHRRSAARVSARASHGLPDQLNPLAVPLALPARDAPVERRELEPRRVQVVRVDGVAERLAGHAAPLELGDGLAERAGHLRELRVLVGVAAVERRRLQLLLDAVEARGD